MSAVLNRVKSNNTKIISNPFSSHLKSGRTNETATVKDNARSFLKHNKKQENIMN